MNRISKSTKREHRERTQPTHRAQLGHLEKKKDYKKRAQDFQQKRDTLKALHKKAAEKNPDEFYYHMINSETRDGVHHEKEKIDQKAVAAQEKLLRRKDLRYVQFKLDIEKKKIDKLKAQLHFTETKRPNKHTIFVDTEEEAKHFNPVEYFHTHSSLLHDPTKRLRREQLQSDKFVNNKLSKKDLAKSDVRRQKQYTELAKRMERCRQLQIVVDKLTVEQHLSQTSKKQPQPKRVKEGSDESAPVYQWKFQRKR